MSGTEPTGGRDGGRDKERTRRGILDAASRLVAEQGGGVSLADVAAAAGISKSGLLHHFPGRDALLLALVEDAAERLWTEVRAHVDLAENRAGKLLRAYVRALTDGGDTVAQVFAPTGLTAAVGRLPGIGEFMERDAKSWREAFAADGIDPARSIVVQHAAEGLAASAGSPYLTADELAAARAHLLELAEP
ncbi:HTH-type transcriptional regulator BetI [Arthrobacter saudimassiliensis]|uniref:HTH-type transcriptional regulator BetI n=1 Tax=Arthrobacter saudimassiliensis TaxID=1461584 RepID=A0A078MN87_9MICC|nr:HTH-type transcriptional regulator BetI [Arthrobacter saudimassiliensis]